MQEVFKKIIEKLEERASFLSDCTKYGNKDAKQQRKSYSTMMMYEVADLVDDLIEIVKHEAEQYEECYKHCGECEAYDKEKHHCPKFCKVIKETVKEIEENHNGWIPTSERLPEEPKTNPVLEGKNLELYLVTTKYGSNEQDKVYPFRAFWNGVNFTDGWHILDVIAWQPLPEPYQPKGE